jgi:hypothetical protein
VFESRAVHGGKTRVRVPSVISMAYACWSVAVSQRQRPALTGTRETATRLLWEQEKPSSTLGSPTSNFTVRSCGVKPGV